MNIIRGKFDLSNRGKYDRKEVSKKLFDYYYEKCKKNQNWGNNKNKIKYPKTAKTFGKWIEDVINESTSHHCDMDMSGYSQKVYGIYGVIARSKKQVF